MEEEKKVVLTFSVVSVQSLANCTKVMGWLTSSLVFPAQQRITIFYGNSLSNKTERVANKMVPVHTAVNWHPEKSSGCERKQTHLLKSRLEKMFPVACCSMGLHHNLNRPWTREVEKEATAFQPHKRVFLWMKNSNMGQNKDKVNCVYFWVWTVIYTYSSPDS